MEFDPWHVFTATFGQVPKPCTALVTMIDMALYFILSVNVSKARGRYKVQAPGIDGPAPFLRAFRIHQNMMEQLVQHLPLLWIAAYAMDDVFAAAVGCVWAFGRSLYAIRYYQKPKRRTKGFIIAFVANAALLLGALVGTLAAL